MMQRLAMFIDGSRNDRDSLRSAMMISQVTGATLDVIHPVENELGVYAMADTTFVAPTNETQTSTDLARAAFEDVCGQASNARFFATAASMEDAICSFGLFYDAVIVERLTEEEGPSARAFNAAIFEIGSPVIVTPPAAQKSLGQIAALVWTGTPQAARALRSSLAVLKLFKEVHVLTNSDNKYAEAAPIMEYLACHNIDTQHHEFDGSQLTARGRGRAIIAAVNSINAEFMVMGVFGESQLDAIFGLGRTT